MQVQMQREAEAEAEAEGRALFIGHGGFVERWKPGARKITVDEDERWPGR
jgi:hypothetical protein